MKVAIEQLYSIFRSYPHICTDTRSIIPNSIFFAIKGESFNGNEFAKNAINSGCSHAVIDEKKFEADDRFLLVDDVLSTLQKLAVHHRSHLKIPFIAITGTNGKTTTKELIRTVLSKKFNTLATAGNLNNHIGVPLTVLSVNDKTEIAVIEMGANHTGEIKFLCHIAQPNYGIITNIGKAHLEGFGSFEGVVRAKSELYDYIRKTHGKVFIHAGNDLLMKQAGNIEKITYGSSGTLNVKGEIASAGEYVKIKWLGTTVPSHLTGQYNAENILCAICVGNYFGIDKETIAEAVKDYVPSNNRSQVIKKNSNTILLDAYNANPSSMEVSVNNFTGMNLPNKMVVLGDMFELGKYAKEEHRKIAEAVLQKGFMKVILVGPEFCEAGKNSSCMLFKNTEEVMEWFRKNPVRNSAILIKGSRGMKLERLVEVL